MPDRLVYLHWLDNNGAPSTVEFRPGIADNDAGLLNRIRTIADAMQSISTGAIVKAEIVWKFDIASPAAAAPGADLQDYGIFYLRGETGVASVSVPATKRLLADVDGDYAGVRISRARLQVLGLLSTVDNMVSGALDPVGRPYGTVFSVGGYAKL